MGLLSALGGMGAPQMPQIMNPGGGIGGGLPGADSGGMGGAFANSPDFAAMLQRLMQQQGPGRAPPAFTPQPGFQPMTPPTAPQRPGRGGVNSNDWRRQMQQPRWF